MLAEREARDTIPVPGDHVWDEAPTWAKALVQEVRTLGDALRETSRLVVAHTTELKRLELSQHALEHRQNQVQDAAEVLAKVIPMRGN